MPCGSAQKRSSAAASSASASPKRARVENGGHPPRGRFHAKRSVYPSSSRYRATVASPAAVHENSRSTMRAAGEAVVREPRGIGERAADRRGQRRRDRRARTSQPFSPGPDLVGNAAGGRGDDRAAMRHRLERHERAALVERRMHEAASTARATRASRRSVTRPRKCTCSCESELRGQHLEHRPIRAVAERDPAPRPAVERAVIAHRRERAQQHVKALARLEPADAQQHALARREIVLPRAASPTSAGSVMRVDAREVERVRNRRASARAGSRDAGARPARATGRWRSRRPPRRAQTRTARRSGRYAARLSGARDGSVAPNSSSPCGFSTSGAVAARAPAPRARA